MGYNPKLYLYIEWPHSQRIMQHPQAKMVENKGTNGIACIIPPEIWEQYKNTYYCDQEINTEDDEENEKDDQEINTEDYEEIITEDDEYEYEYNYDEDERQTVLDIDNNITFDTYICVVCGLVDSLKNSLLMLECCKCNGIVCEK